MIRVTAISASCLAVGIAIFLLAGFIFLTAEGSSKRFARTLMFFSMVMGLYYVAYFFYIGETQLQWKRAEQQDWDIVLNVFYYMLAIQSWLFAIRYIESASLLRRSALNLKILQNVVIALYVIFGVVMILVGMLENVPDFFTFLAPYQFVWAGLTLVSDFLAIAAIGFITNKLVHMTMVSQLSYKTLLLHAFFCLM